MTNRDFFSLSFFSLIVLRNKKRKMLSPTNGNGDIEKSTVAVAIDKDKGSQQAFKWAIENVLNPGEGISLIHVKQQFSVAPTPRNRLLISLLQVQILCVTI